MSAEGRTLRRVGLLLLLIGASLGEGGATPTALVLWHATLAALVALEIWERPRSGAVWGTARGPANAFLLYVAIATLGAMRAPYGFAAWLFLLELGCFAGVAWLAARCGPQLLSRLATPLLVAAAAQAVLLLAQRYGLAHARPAGTFLNPNHLAAWMTAILLLAWGTALARRELSGRRSLALAVGTASIVAALVATGSRGAFIGLVAGLVVVVLRGWSTWPRAWRRGAVGAALLVLLLVGLGLGIRLRQPDPFRYQRVRIWAASVGVLADDPWFGTGPRQFGHASRLHQFPDGDGPLRFDRGFRSTHSDWLRAPCELGWPGALALLATIALTWRHARRQAGGAHAGAAAALVALGAQAAFENLSTRPAVYLLAAALCGAMVSERREARVPLPSGARVVATALLWGAFAIGEAAPYLAWRAAGSAGATAVAVDRLAELREALARNPVHPDYFRQLAEAIAAEGASWDLKSYALAREAAETAVRLHPTGSEFHRELARVEARACRGLFRDTATRERAAAAYGRAEALEPFNPFLPLEAGAFLLDTGDATGAIGAAHRALELEPESARPRLLLAAALLESGAADGPARAAELLRQAREAAARWGSWAATGEYARNLLTLDVAAVARIEAELGRRARDEGAGLAGATAMRGAPAFH